MFLRIRFISGHFRPVGPQDRTWYEHEGKQTKDRGKGTVVTMPARSKKSGRPTRIPGALLGHEATATTRRRHLGPPADHARARPVACRGPRRVRDRGPAEPPDADLRTAPRASRTSTIDGRQPRTRDAPAARWRRRRWRCSAWCPAAWSVLRLAWYVRRRGIDVDPHRRSPARRSGRCSPQSHHSSKVHRARHTSASTPSGCEGRCSARFAAPTPASRSRSIVAGTLRDAGCDPSSTYVVLNGIEPARWQPGRGRETVRRELEIARHDTRAF